MPMNVWTVGHSTHTFEAFVRLLEMHDISLLADVRTVPKSRRHPHFHAEALARTLPGRGVTYVELPQLGGWRRATADSPNSAWRNLSFRGYADYAMDRRGAETRAGPCILGLAQMDSSPHRTAPTRRRRSARCRT